MRVLMVNRSDSEKRPGGDTVQMIETARALEKLGVEVVSRYGPGSFEQGFDIVHAFNLQTPFETLVTLEKARAANVPTALSTIYWDFGAEKLIASSKKWQLLQKLLGTGLAKNLARREVDKHAKEGRDAMRQCLLHCDMVLPNSHAEYGHLKDLVTDVPQAWVVPNGIDAVRFDPHRQLGKPENLPDEFVLIVARIERDKNQAAFCERVCSRYPVVLAGWTNEPEEAQRCEAAGAILRGSIQGDDLVALYQHARVHALPSFRETPGLASLEAAAIGCAIVSTSQGSAREYFEDEVEYVDPMKPKTFLTAVERAWESGRQSKLSERVRREYDWSVVAASTLDAYRALLDWKRGAK